MQFITTGKSLAFPTGLVDKILYLKTLCVLDARYTEIKLELNWKFSFCWPNFAAPDISMQAPSLRQL